MLSQLLDQKVVACQGAWRHIKRWWKGILPERGTISFGWTGLETVEESDRFYPLHTFRVGPDQDGGPTAKAG